MRSITTILGALTFTLLTPAVSLGIVGNSDVAGAPMMTQGWSLAGGLQPVVDVPTNGFLSLGVQFQRGCYDTRFDVLDVRVTLDGVPIDGTVVEGPQLGNVALFEPGAPLEANRRYRVVVSTIDDGRGCSFAQTLVDQDFITAAGPAEGPLEPTVLTVTEQRSCGWSATFVEMSSPHDPYVSYEVTDYNRDPRYVAFNPAQISADFGDDQCLNVKSTHRLTGESEVQQVCRDTAVLEEGLCPEEAEGCSGGTPTQNWPMLLVVGGLLLVALRRRRGLV